MENITKETVDKIDELYENGKKLTQKTVTSMITNICDKHGIFKTDTVLAKKIICKLSEGHIFSDICVKKIIQHEIFVTNDEWLKNLAKNGYKPNDQMIDILKSDYYYLIVNENTDIEKMLSCLCKIPTYYHNGDKLKKIFMENNIAYDQQHKKYWKEFVNTLPKYYDLGWENILPMTKDYLQLLLSCGMSKHVDYKKCVDEKVITKFSDVFETDEIIKKDCSVSFWFVFDNLSANNVWPTLADLNKFEYLGSYNYYKIYVVRCLENEPIKNLSECKVLYGGVHRICPEGTQEIIKICSKRNIDIDSEFINYSSYESKIGLLQVHEENINCLLQKIKIIDVSSILATACEIKDEILFMKIIDYARNKNMTDDEIFADIDINELLRGVLFNIKNIADFGIEIVNTLLNMKVEPKNEYITDYTGFDVIELLINYGLQINDKTLEKMIKNHKFINLDNHDYDIDKVYKYCCKYNFFPIEYKKYFGKKYDAHMKINKIMNKRHISCVEHNMIINIIEENKLGPSTHVYDRAVALFDFKLVEYLENRYKINPGFGLLKNYNKVCDANVYLAKCLRHYKLEHLFETTIED